MCPKTGPRSNAFHPSVHPQRFSVFMSSLVHISRNNCIQLTFDRVLNSKMVHCIAFGCKNKDESLKQGVSFFRLPKDPSRRKVWIQQLKLVNPPKDSDNVRICSEHFSEDCFVRDMQAEWGFKKRRRTLKDDAVPSKFVFSKLAQPRKTFMRRRQQTYRREVSLTHVLLLLSVISHNIRLLSAYIIGLVYDLPYHI